MMLIVAVAHGRVGCVWRDSATLGRRQLIWWVPCFIRALGLAAIIASFIVARAENLIHLVVMILLLIVADVAVGVPGIVIDIVSASQSGPSLSLSDSFSFLDLALRAAIEVIATLLVLHDAFPFVIFTLIEDLRLLTRASARATATR